MPNFELVAKGKTQLLTALLDLSEESSTAPYAPTYEQVNVVGGRRQERQNPTSTRPLRAKRVDIDVPGAGDLDEAIATANAVLDEIAEKHGLEDDLARITVSPRESL